MLKAIVFDGYGTLFDTGTGSVDAVRDILFLNGHPEISPHQFYSEWKVLHQGHMDHLPQFVTEREIYALDLEELYRRYGFFRDAGEDVAVMLRIQGKRQVYPEVSQVLDKLESRFLLAIGSTTDTAPLLEDLQRGGLSFAPSRIFTSQSLGVYKPKREFYQAILDSLGLAPQETLFVGDSLVNDIQGPQSVGMRTCWVNRKGKTADTIHPDFQIATLEGLADLATRLAE
ncbi:MAG: HAD family hydrolase [Acutalibacter sp.]|jgi:putative hydrolase of the HAD superfamily